MDQGKRTKESQGELIKNSSKIGGVFKVGPPTFQEQRVKLFDQIYVDQQKILTSVEHRPIKITLKDGKVIDGVAFETTPLIVATKISKQLASKIIVAKVKYSNRIPIEMSSGEIVDTDKEDNSQTEKKDSYELWDISRPFEGDCNLELLQFNDPEGQETFWHSSAHLLGAALEEVFGAYLCIGPPLENGFFYDTYMGQHKVVSEDYEKIEKAFMKLTQEKQPFQRVVLTKLQALELFATNPFKVQLITNKIPENGLTTAYKCGKLIDLCTGPHLPTTDKIKAFKVTKNSAAYWLGKNTNDDLQRVYGIAFPEEKQLKEYIRIQEELAKRDHRNVGKQNQLFMFNHLSPGSTFFYPAGAHIYNTLMNFLREQYKYRGYTEVISPNFYNVQLWKISGHYDKYKENMFLINMGDEGEYGVKPMNCPGHCVMFDMVQHSYRDLPIRYADFGVLHRNEVHGALSGLTRVRRFQQDDAHIFCRQDQIQQEISGCLDFLSYIYQIFGFEYKLYLSTRPEKFLGTTEIWDNAEKQLKQSLEAFGKPFEINPGDGAFYGPKIDVKLYDAYKREHQCGTIQLDFNLPERFNLQFRSSEDTEEVLKDKEKTQKEQEVIAQTLLEVRKSSEEQSDRKSSSELNQQVQNLQKEEQKKLEQQSQPQVEESSKQDPIKSQHSQSENLTPSQIHSVLHEKKYELGYHHLKAGFQRPIIVHRAIYGSFERFLAILTENFGGKWPFWLSPKQLSICPISQKYNDYAEKLALRIRLEGYQAESESSDMTLNKKVRMAQLAHFNYIGVIGAEEEASGSIDIRDRDKNERIGKFTVEELLDFFKLQNPAPSSLQENLKKQAYQRKNEEEYAKLNLELSLKVYLTGDGFQPGQQDEELYLKLHDQVINSKIHPNLYRWLNHMKYIKSQQAPQQ